MRTRDFSLVKVDNNVGHISMYLVYRMIQQDPCELEVMKPVIQMHKKRNRTTIPIAPIIAMRKYGNPKGHLSSNTPV
jgi:hypothetical protein